MDYPGNATLTREMQERILSTFKQTLSAAAAGNRQEAKLGCDFILRLDSLFGPARELLQRLEVGEGPVSTADLAAIVGEEGDEPAAAPASEPTPEAATPAAAAPAAAPQPPDIDDLSDLDLEMGLSDPVPAAPQPTPEPAPPAAPPPVSPAEPAAPVAGPAVPPEPQAPLAVDELDDLDLGLDEDTAEAPAPPPAAAEPAMTPPPAAAPPLEAPPTDAPRPEATAPAPEVPEAPFPEAAEAMPPAAAEPAPPVPEVPQEPAPEPTEAAPPPVAAEPEAAVAAAPEAPAAPELDELDDLDLSVGAEATPQPADEAPAELAEEPEPPAAEAVAEEPPAAEPVAEEPPAAEAVPEERPAEEAAEPAAEAEAPQEEPAAEEPAAEEPAAPPPAPESVEIPLDSEPAAQLDSESQQRIDDLLAEGQQAFDAGEYQGAIDAWSRIFLIDIDHAEANRRIEEARKLKAEADRKVEEKFHEGLSQLEAGEAEAATETFRAVLDLQSSHMQARNYLEKLEAGEVPVPTELRKAPEVEAVEAEMEAVGAEPLEEAEDEPKAKPDRGTKAVGERVVTVKKSPFKSKSFMAIAAAGLIAVLGGAWYLFNNWSTLFPNSAQEAPARAAPDPVARAKGLHEQGKTPIAIAQLRRLPPDSPQYDEAQALIAQWELEQAPADTGPQGPSPEELARREALVAEAAAAAERREFMRTSELLSEAAAIAPLKGSEAQLLARADEELQELQTFINYFREGEWDLGLRDLWLLHQSDPGNRDVTRLLVDSYYNLGLRALQRKDAKVAAEQFQEALELSPEDPELLRLADFAATYQTRSTDLLYRIFVKYHPFR